MNGDGRLARLGLALARARRGAPRQRALDAGRSAALVSRPAGGVPDTGPFNAHFVRDIGVAFLAAGVALVWAALRAALRGAAASRRGALPGSATRCSHVFDTARGVVLRDHWWLETCPACYLPALARLLAGRRLAARPAEDS